MSEPPKPTPSDRPFPETTEQPPDRQFRCPASPRTAGRWTNRRWGRRCRHHRDQLMRAVRVECTQTRVLSQRQEVMAEQQRIMTESAKAQLWPNLEVYRVRGSN